MNDEFLTRPRKPPRREIAYDFHERINKPTSKGYLNYDLISRRAALTVSALYLLLFLTFLISPDARAFASDQIRQIGALIFRRVDENRVSIEAEASPPTPAVPALGDMDPP